MESLNLEWIADMASRFAEAPVAVVVKAPATLRIGRDPYAWHSAWTVELRMADAGSAFVSEFAAWNVSDGTGNDVSDAVVRAALPTLRQLPIARAAAARGGYC